MVFFVLAVLGCAQDFVDTSPSYPGWAVEASLEGGPLLVGAHPLLIDGRALEPCADCVVESEGELTVRVRLDHLGSPPWGSEGGVDLALEVGDERAERVLTRTGEVLLRVPVLESCGQSCVAEATLLVDAQVEVRGSWTAHVAWTSAHDSPSWKPEARLELRGAD